MKDRLQPPTAREIVGVYGGTFNPPHLGHRAAAEAFVAEVRPDRLLVIPDHLPPHKDISGGVSDTDRLQMARLAFFGIPSVEVSDIEIRRGGKSYTYETLAALSSPKRDLYLLVGTDMFLSLDNWRCPERIFSSCAVVCARREFDPQTNALLSAKKAEYIEKFKAEIIFLQNPVIEISSTDLRDALARGEESVPALPREVLA